MVKFRDMVTAILESTDPFGVLLNKVRTERYVGSGIAAIGKKIWAALESVVEEAASKS